MSTENNRYDYDDEIELRELIQILLGKKWLIVGTTVIVATLALIYSFMLTPVYESDAKIALGNTGHQMYTEATSAKEVILSRDMMMDIIKEFDLKNNETGEYKDPEKFKDNISVEAVGGTKLIKLKVKTNDPQLSHDIARFIRIKFIEQSQAMYVEKKSLVESLHAQYLTSYEQTSLSLDQNKQSLTAIETSNELGIAEKEIIRARLLDYVIKDENTLNSLESSIRSVQAQLLDMQGAEVFERANMPERPVSPNKTLNLAIGLVLGLMIGVFATFIIEYFKNNPINLKDETKVAK